MGAKVLSNSWRYREGNPHLTDIQALRNAVEAADANGVLFVAAAGNETSDNDYIHTYPASYDCNNIISVLATDKYDNKADFSNYGATSVDLGAPGTDILSCWPGGQYDYLDGTSESTPYVAGVCALVWSFNPVLSHLQVKDIILNSVDQIPDLNDRCVTGGRLNLFNALANTPTLILNKVDDINDGNGVIPGDYITYTISYANPVIDSCDPNYIGNVNNAVITDFIPDDLIFSSAYGPNSVYHLNTHTVTWNIGTLKPNDSCSVTLTVKVNYFISGCGAITNLCKIEGGNGVRWAWASKNTPVSCASNPTPTRGEIVYLCTCDHNLNLTWCPGHFAAALNGHEVYFGTNFNDVHDANSSWPLGEVYKGTVTNPFFPIERSGLELGKTYYWRIDEVNTSHPDMRWKGSVWSFTTDCYLVENFNSYSDDLFWAVWKDGWTNYTQSEIFLGKPPLQPARDGNSMEYRYTNANYPYYAEAEATIGTGTSKARTGLVWMPQYYPCGFMANQAMTPTSRCISN
jgi:hypothetical protein